jgi:methyl-accepting chemotaxis protein
MLHGWQCTLCSLGIVVLQIKNLDKGNTMKVLRNFTVGARLSAGFAALMVLIVLLAGSSLVQGVKSRGELYASLKNMENRVQLAQKIRFEASEENVLLYRLAVQKSDEAERNGLEILGTLKGLKASISQTIESLQKFEQDDGDRQLMGQISQKTQNVDQVGVEIAQLAVAGNGAQATDMLVTRLPLLRQEQTLELNKYVDQLTHEQEELPIHIEQAFRAKAYRSVFVVVASIILFGIIIARLLTRSVTAPLKEAVAIANKISQGNLSLSVETGGKDELSELMFAIHGMDKALTETISKVRASTDVISVAAREIAQGNLDLSARTESQASSLEETAASMEELTSTVQQNSENARQAAQLAQSASEVAARGGVVVSQVVHTMGAISDSANKIVDIISVIDGIAFQTNILALNAAVEAARAGEQGRGFAVVATEVRNLAQRSAGAAKEIKQLINDSVEKVGAGSKLVDRAGATMGEVVSGVRRVTEIMAEITAASTEQSQGIGQVNQAVIEMDNVTQQNAALVEQAAAAATSMQEQAVELSNAVSVFRINGPDYSTATISASVLPLSAATRIPAPRNALNQPVSRTKRGAGKSMAFAGQHGVAHENSDGWEEF